jgi:hypothetical protein
MELAAKGRILNCDVTRQDIINAKEIFGPELGCLKGKTVRTASNQVQAGGLVPIPATIMAHYRKVVLCVDVMKVNKMPFLVTISRALKFGTVAWLKNAKADTILSHITGVRNVYIKRGFLLEVVKVDGQFEPLRGTLAEMGVTLNKCSREGHVPVAERRIHTLKERCRCICNTLPSKKLPGMLVVQMVSTCNFWLNIFPPKDGVSRDINPRELITGVKIDYNKHIQAEFGEYVQVHEEHNNSMQTQTTGAITTKPTGNAQGGHWFYSLTTGRMLDRCRWTPLPTPADVIERLSALAKANSVGMTFTNMQNEEYIDDAECDSDVDSDNDSDYDSDDASSDGDNDDYEDFIAGVDNNHPAPPDPPDANVNENYNNDEDTDENYHNDDASEDDNDNTSVAENEDDPSSDENDHDDAGSVPTNDADEAVVVPLPLKKLTDWAGAMPPVIHSRTRQQAQATVESLLTVSLPDWLQTEPNPEEWSIQKQENAETWTVVKAKAVKKQRKHRETILDQLLKQREAENKKKLRNKTKNAKRKLRLKNQKEDCNVPGLMIDEILEAEYEQKHGHPSPIPFGFNGCVPPKTKKSLLLQIETVNDFRGIMRPIWQLM